MDRAELLRHLRGSGDADVACKATSGGVPDDAYKTVSAFSNTSGGWLVFGVAERRGVLTVTGVAEPDRLQDDFVRACRSPERFSRPIDVIPRLLRLDQASVLCFRVPAAPRYDKPVRARSRKTWETYIRLGAADHLCSLEEEARFLRDASLDDFDGLLCPDLALEDLSPRAIRWFRGALAQRNPDRAHSDLDDAAWLAALGLIREGGGLTNAAALLFGRDRVMVRLKPAGVLDLRIIEDDQGEGSPEDRWDDRELYEDNLVSTLRGALDRMEPLLPEARKLGGDERRSVARAADRAAVREALVNLVAHQDYSDRNRTARVLWHRDQVLFENPGDALAPLEHLQDGGVSQLRNPLLTRMLRLVGYPEQAGAGIAAILRRWREAGRASPHLENDPGRKQFALTLAWRSGGSRSTGSGHGPVQSPPESAPPTSASSPVMRAHGTELLRLIATYPGQRVPTLVTATGWSAATVKRALAWLRDQGEVVFEGAPRNGGYRATRRVQDV